MTGDLRAWQKYPDGCGDNYSSEMSGMLATSVLASNIESAEHDLREATDKCNTLK